MTAQQAPLRKSRLALAYVLFYLVALLVLPSVVVFFLIEYLLPMVWLLNAARSGFADLLETYFGVVSHFLSKRELAHLREQLAERGVMAPNNRWRGP